MYQQILVPLDGSARAEHALPIAARIARASAGTVVLLQAVGYPAIYGSSLSNAYLMTPPSSSTFAIDQDVLEAERDQAQHYLDHTAQASCLKGVKTETRTDVGLTAQVILDQAATLHTDLIVMCSHGRTGFTRWMLGSVAQKVIRHSSLPVLLLRNSGFETTMLTAKANKPLRAEIALDGSPFAEATLTPAANLVAALAAPGPGALHLTQVIRVTNFQHNPKDRQRDLPGIEQATSEAARYLSTVAETLTSGTAKDLGVSVTWSVMEHEDIANALIKMAELGEDTGNFQIEKCDLIAMTTHGQGASQRWTMGSITERALDGTRLPLLIVRPHM